MKSKDIIILLGPSGAGKTTVIQIALGYRLRKGKKNNLSTLVVRGKMDKEHEEFITSPACKSCTRYIKVVKLPERLFELGENPDVYIGDTAGFEDTAGSEVDASNGLATVQALK